MTSIPYSTFPVTSGVHRFRRTTLTASLAMCLLAMSGLAMSQDSRPYISTVDPVCVNDHRNDDNMPEWELKQLCEVRVYSSTPAAGVPNSSGVIPKSVQPKAVAAVPASTPTAEQIRAYIRDQGIANNPQAIYAAAQQYSVSGAQLDSAMGWSPGTANNWVRQQGLSPLKSTAQQAPVAVLAAALPKTSSIPAAPSAPAVDTRPYMSTVDPVCVNDHRNDDNMPEWELKQLCEVRVYSSTPAAGVPNSNGVIPSAVIKSGLSTATPVSALNRVNSVSVSQSYLAQPAAPVPTVDTRPYMSTVDPACVNEHRNDENMPEWELKQLCEVRVYSSTPSAGVPNALGVIPTAASLIALDRQTHGAIIDLNQTVNSQAYRDARTVTADDAGLPILTFDSDASQGPIAPSSIAKPPERTAIPYGLMLSTLSVGELVTRYSDGTSTRVVIPQAPVTGVNSPDASTTVKTPGGTSPSGSGVVQPTPASSPQSTRRVDPNCLVNAPTIHPNWQELSGMERNEVCTVTRITPGSGLNSR